jgi:hypothetical protein
MAKINYKSGVNLIDKHKRNIEIAKLYLEDFDSRFESSSVLNYDENKCKFEHEKKDYSKLEIKVNNLVDDINFYISPFNQQLEPIAIAEKYIEKIEDKYNNILQDYRGMFVNGDLNQKNKAEITFIDEKNDFILQFKNSYPFHLKSDNETIAFCKEKIDEMINNLNVEI